MAVYKIVEEEEAVTKTVVISVAVCDLGQRHPVEVSAPHSTWTAVRDMIWDTDVSLC